MISFHIKLIFIHSHAALVSHDFGLPVCKFPNYVFWTQICKLTGWLLEIQPWQQFPRIFRIVTIDPSPASFSLRLKTLQRDDEPHSFQRKKQGKVEEEFLSFLASEEKTEKKHCTKNTLNKTRCPGFSWDWDELLLGGDCAARMWLDQPVKTSRFLFF